MMNNAPYIDDSGYDWDFSNIEKIASKSPETYPWRAGDQSSETRNRFDDELRLRPIEVVSFENIKHNIGDVLIVKYDIENCSSDAIHEFSEHLSRIYPGKKIFIIPNSCDLVYMDKEQLIELRDSLNKLIDASDYDSLL